MALDKNSPMGENYELIRSLEIVNHKKRQEFLDLLISGMIKSRSVVFTEIGDKLNLEIKQESIERRIQDFFQKVEFDYVQLMVFFLSFVPNGHQKQLKLSIDRTEWDFGKTQINILCVVVSIGKMGIPLYFEMLDNNSGNSSSDDRIELFKTIINTIGAERIGVLIMDREFIGQKWLKWLKNKRIPFCVRVPKHHTITLADGNRVKAENYLLEHGASALSNVIVDGVVVNCSLSWDKNGDLLFLIGTIPLKELKSTYKKRWTIEVVFQALKGRGFDMEKSRLRCLEKYRKLFAVAAMAYTLCWAIGIEDGKNNPVKPKKHGYPQYSVFRRGLNLMRTFYKGIRMEAVNYIQDIISMVFQNAHLRIGAIFKTIG